MSFCLESLPSYAQLALGEKTRLVWVGHFITGQLYEEFCPNWVSIKLFVVALIGHNFTPMRALPKTPPAKGPQIYERQNQQKLQKLEF